MYEKSKILFAEHFSSIIIYMAVFIFVWWVMLCRGNVQDNCNGAESVGSRIDTATKLTEQARTEQQVAEQGINQAINRVETIQRSVSETGSVVDQHRASIERSQRIIDQVRKRGKS